jgi:hypothetical protein
MNRMNSKLKVLVLAALAGPAGALLFGCDESSSAVKEASPDAAPSPTTSPTSTSPPIVNLDAGPDAPTDCYLNPTTHLEIINACTTAVKIVKNPALAKVSPDGGLPPLP